MKHISSKGISARNYIALLALEDITEERQTPSRSKKK
jgi:hypothetical protein